MNSFENALPLIVHQLTQLLDTKLSEMEDRIVSRLSREIALSEDRLAKLILNGKDGGARPTIDEGELDLD